MTTFWRSHRLPVGALLGAGFAAYADSFRGVFQFDDTANILEDARLISAAEYFRHLAQMIRPVTKFTYLIDRQLYGERPAGYHVLSLVLHLACGVLVYGILRESSNCLERGRRTAGPSAFACLPFWTSLLFLVHPIGTETVTYLSGRATGLMAFFYLTSFYLFIRSTRLPQKRREFLLSYGGALGCFVLSLLSKEVAVTLPVALVLWEIVFVRRKDTPVPYPALRVHSAFWGIAILFLGIVGYQPRYRYLLDTSFQLRPLWENLATQINAVAYGVGLFFSPARLNFDHDLPLYHSILEWPTPLSLSILLGLLSAGILWVRRMPFLGFGLVWFILQMIPTNSVIPRYDLLSERNLYLPSIGLFLAIVSLWSSSVEKLTSKFRERAFHPPGMELVTLRLLGSVPILFSLFLLFGTVARNRIYVNQVAFWKDAVRKSPRKARPHNNLGYAYFLAGDVNHAIGEFRVAVALDPTFATAQENLLKTSGQRHPPGATQSESDGQRTSPTPSPAGQKTNGPGDGC